RAKRLRALPFFAPRAHPPVADILSAPRRRRIRPWRTFFILCLGFSLAPRASGDVHYVDAASTNATAPYTNWSDAATVIQDAVDAASDGDTVLVTNGVYGVGGAAGYPDGTSLSNRVAIYRALTVQSVNGPDVTVIEGQGPVGSNAVRCAYVGSNAWLIGFTLTNGATHATGLHHATGGGAWSERGAAVVSNCTLSGNAAGESGGGSYGGILIDCTLSGNSAGIEWGAGEGGGSFRGHLTRCMISGNSATMRGGGSAWDTLVDCVLSANSCEGKGGGCSIWAVLTGCILSNNVAVECGGGVSDECTLSNCLLVGNRAIDMDGGGAEDSTLVECVLLGNSAGEFGGGSFACVLTNCLLAGNMAAQVGGGSLWDAAVACTLVANVASNRGGGAHYSTLQNSIVYLNSAPTGPNHDDSALDYCCTTPLPTSGVGNITSAPLFVDTNAGNYRLRTRSPCVDAGMNVPWMWHATDLDGNPRIVNGAVDMGAYEVASTIDARVLLQGGYDTNAHRMRVELGSSAIPAAAPYASDNRLASAMLGDVVDWVYLELRDTNDEPVVSRSVWVNANGYVLSDDGAIGVTVAAAEGESYALVLKHRNHLTAMSSGILDFTNQYASYDFTTNSTCYSGGTNACVELEPGVWGMIAGDADGDGKITWVDRAIASNQVGRSGYWCGDIDLSGTVEE
ncbi:MAG: hypothetical protein JXR37_30300, partial [Kiritimatiellae bacterium]|nr:hypothetical protein [Kiritimatiellia bacterium]